MWSFLFLGLVLQEAKPMRPNRLVGEKSPYLLQHAYNPVDWHPWGAAAFEKAKKEGKPIFLSVGYSTCHWCHVMEKESFESEEIAAILNGHFVSIKVDREERPDIDRIYMSFVQATTGSGGWPMSVWLTPDLKPFYGGTYFPPESRWGRPGFGEILLKIAEAWEKEKTHVLESADRIAASLREFAAQRASAEGEIGESILRGGYRQFESSYDARFAGFGGAPKFPRPSTLQFLLRYHARTGERRALEMAAETLRAMAKGGMYDQMGGGFHRYSTDERWHVPHFEKMLYDQAQIVVALVEAYQATRDPLFARVAREVCDYVLREMASPEGGFYSAQDADSAEDAAHPEEKKEGAFFVWTKAEIEKTLGTERAALFCFRFGASEAGNALADPHGEFRGKNILFQAQTVEATAAAYKKTKEETEKSIEECRAILFRLREARPRPHLDDKILTAWNGLMISGFAKAGAALGEPRYVEAAEKAARFLLAKMREPKSGRLLRRYRDGEAAIPAFHDDYAFLVQGLLDLYEAGGDASWILRAEEIAREQRKLFWDEEAGAFYETAGDDPSVILRTRESYDGAEPASNSAAALNGLRLAQLTGKKDFEEAAERSLRFFGGHLEKAPHALPQMLAALDFRLGKHRQIVIAGKPGAPDTRRMLEVANARFLPNKVLLLADGGDSQKALAKLLPFLESISAIDGKATAYVCENYACKAPTNDPENFARQLSQ